MNVQKMKRWGVAGVLLVLLGSSVAFSQIPAGAEWIIGDWRHTKVVVRIDWSFSSVTSPLGEAIMAESKVMIGRTPISEKFSLIRRESGGFRSHIFEIEENRTKSFMFIKWSGEIGTNWSGDLSGVREGGDLISGTVELNKVNDNQFTYRITDLTIGDEQKPDVELTFTRR